MGVTFGDGCAENATDGNLNTCATSGFNLNKWVVIDLGSVQTFRSIKLAGKRPIVLTYIYDDAGVNGRKKSLFFWKTTEFKIKKIIIFPKVS